MFPSNKPFFICDIKFIINCMHLMQHHACLLVSLPIMFLCFEWRVWIKILSLSACICSYLINIIGFLFQVHCLQFLIYEVVSGGNIRKPGGLFGNSGSEIPVNDLKQLETTFYKLGFFLHILDYSGKFLIKIFFCTRTRDQPI